MLYIVDFHKKEFKWHVGEPVPNMPLFNISAIQADEDELYFIINRAASIIPVDNKRVQTWEGGMALFVYGVMKGAY